MESLSLETAAEGTATTLVYLQSFNGKLRDELPNGDIFYTRREAQILVERWQKHYNEVRPHRSLGYKPPAPQTRESVTNRIKTKKLAPVVGECQLRPAT